MLKSYRQFAKSKKGRFIVTGVPFVLAVVGGSFFLSKFTKSQTDMKDDMITSKSTRQFDVDAEYETIIEQLKIDDYQLSRIPRPEDKNEVTKKPKIN